MFSAVAAEDGPARGTRSSRRRQRPSTGSDSLVQQQPKAKRQRVPLSEATFVNPEAQPEMYEVKSDKVDLYAAKRDGYESPVIHAVPRKELTVRSKKAKAGERVNKGDGSVVLTTTAAYTVSKLPALPDRIRSDSQNKQHGAIHSSHGYGLAITHTHALVWPYTSTTSSPETFTFSLPYPAKQASDPLPLGTLVSPSAASEEPGLVVVMPMSGKITYWESISSAATLDFIRQQRTGVEDAIHGMFSGEHVVQLVNAESAGFVLVFSTGRLAYLNVRDSHGRPAISVQFLRGGLSNTSGGILGSIRHALSTSSLKGDVAAAHANHGTKVGERAIVAATTKGRLHGWRLHRGGHNETFADVDIREAVIEAVENTDAQITPESFEIIDFAFVPRGVEKKYRDFSRFSDAISSMDESLQHLLLLVSFGGKRYQQYALVEVTLAAGTYQVGMVRPITSYNTPIRTIAPVRPRVYLPRPALVAFVVFDRAVVVASLAALPDTPESQLQEEIRVLPATFEDVIDFRDEDLLEIVGSGLEEPTAIASGSAADDVRAHRHKTKNPATVLLVRGVGVVRVAITDIDRFVSNKPPQVTAKSKLEQAVFFGIKDDNPLVFEGRRNLQFSSKEIGDAAVQLSHEIVSSKTPFIANLPASMENNMRMRINCLEKLIAHLNVLKVDLDQRTRWMLLFNAEKMFVATWIWKQHEKFLAQRGNGDKKSVISETAVFINEQQKTEPNPAIGEVDPVRHWFINDVWRLEIFVAWGYEIIKYSYQESLTDLPGLNRLLYEAVSVASFALSEAHRYRAEQAEVYGVRKWSANAGVPEPWNATAVITNNLKRLVEFCYKWLDTYKERKDPTLDYSLLEIVQAKLPALTDQYLLSLAEYAEWASLHDGEEIRRFGKICEEAYVTDSYNKILKLNDSYGLWNNALELSMKHQSFHVMARLLVDEYQSRKQLASAKTYNAADHWAAMGKIIGKYFEQYGEDFAFPAYEIMLETRGVSAVLDFTQDKQGFKTQFLRSKPELAKLSWMNDIDREKDVKHAASTLLDLGLNREQQIWCKKIEISLGKLALLADEAEQHQSPDENGDEVNAKTLKGIERIDRELELIRIQEALYDQILPSIAVAIDESAEVQLAMQAHGPKIAKNQKQRLLADIFENALVRLLKHEALDPLSLIDLLTLCRLKPEHVVEIGDQFFLALRVASLALKGDELTDTTALIWRRCYVRDDWKAINETNDKADIVQLEALGSTAAYSAMFAVVERHKQDESFFPVMRPSQSLGVYTERLDRRFNDMDDTFRHGLIDAMKQEDVKLRTFIEKHQLDSWHRTVLEEAEKSVAREYDMQIRALAGSSSAHDDDSKEDDDAVRKEGARLL